MNKIILSVIGLLTWGNAFCQTGINTQTPQQALHISGTPSASTAVGTTGKFVVTPTMRVQGLNQTNNKAHPAASATSTQPVYATSSGDLVIGNRSQIIKQTLPGTDLLVSTILNIPTGAAGATAKIFTDTIIIKQPSLVYFSANISFAFKATNNALLIDGASKMGGLEFSFSSAPTGSVVPTGTYFAAEQYSFAQANTYTTTGGFHGTINLPFGYFVFTLAKAVKLTTGTYIFNIIASGSAGTGTGFNLYYGGGNNDQINITAVTL